MTTSWKMGSCAHNPCTGPRASPCPSVLQSVCHPCPCVPQRMFPLANSDHGFPAKFSLPPLRWVFPACLVAIDHLAEGHPAAWPWATIQWATTTPSPTGLSSSLSTGRHSKFVSSLGTFLRPRVFFRVLFTSHSYHPVILNSSLY